MASLIKAEAENTAPKEEYSAADFVPPLMPLSPNTVNHTTTTTAVMSDEAMSVDNTEDMDETGAAEHIPDYAVPMMIDTKTGTGTNLRTDAKTITATRLNRLKELSEKPEDELDNIQKTEKKRIIRLEKNRRAAAMSRRKKKMYIRNLEERAAMMAKHLAILEMENNQLRGMVGQLSNQLAQYQQVPPEIAAMQLSAPYPLMSLNPEDESLQVKKRKLNNGTVIAESGDSTVSHSQTSSSASSQSGDNLTNFDSLSPIQESYGDYHNAVGAPVGTQMDMNTTSSTTATSTQPYADDTADIKQGTEMPYPNAQMAAQQHPHPAMHMPMPPNGMHIPPGMPPPMAPGMVPFGMPPPPFMPAGFPPMNGVPPPYMMAPDQKSMMWSHPPPIPQTQPQSHPQTQTHSHPQPHHPHQHNLPSSQPYYTNQQAGMTTANNDTTTSTIDIVSPEASVAPPIPLSDVRNDGMMQSDNHMTGLAGDVVTSF